MCLGDLSKDHNKHSRKDAGLYGNLYNFSISYSAATSDEILEIHKYLMKKNNIM